MTLTTNGLNWLAQNAGSGNCFTSSGVRYRDADGVSQTGGTKDVVNAFVVANMVDKKTVDIISGTNYNEFRSINNNTDVSIGDVGEAADREAAGGSYPRYCVGTTTTCTPGERRCKDRTTIEQCRVDGSGWYLVSTCPAGRHCSGGGCVADTPTEPGDRPETGPLKVYVGESDCEPGEPSVELDISGAYTFFKASPYEYIGVGGIEVRNLHSTCHAYFVWETRVWDGYGYTTCPTFAPEMQEISRFLARTGSKPITTEKIGSYETEVVWGSFEIIPGMEGEKTICLSLWGNLSRAELLAELGREGYS
jgi:hypothetical protein